MRYETIQSFLSTNFCKARFGALTGTLVGVENGETTWEEFGSFL